MSTEATRIRDAIIARVQTLAGYTSFRKTPVAQLQPEQLPAMSVFILSEQMQPDGDANAGEPNFSSTVTIGISVIRGFEDPATLEGQVDADVDAIETLLLCDPTFVHFGPDPLFEAVTSINRRRLYPQAGETYLAELRLEIAFLARVSYPPRVTDILETVHVTTKPALSGNPTPLSGEITLETV
ncbi:MAG: hypothetical protein AB7U62_04355 [Pseudolabrys sp.]